VSHERYELGFISEDDILHIHRREALKSYMYHIAGYSSQEEHVYCQCGWCIGPLQNTYNHKTTNNTLKDLGNMNVSIVI
jgi:hypothetical protein